MPLPSTALARTLEHATAALDFELPLESGDHRRVNLNEVRGGDSIERLKRLLKARSADQPLHAVFASHRGAGKSTELKGLQHDIASEFFTIYFEANVEMDSNRFAMEDLLLVIARVVEERMRKRNTPIAPALLEKVERWFSDVVLTDEQAKTYLAQVQTEAKAEGGIPFIAKLLASISAGFKVESAHRESIKSTLKKFPGTLLTLVNELLDDATKKLHADGAGPRGLLLLIDNMDRYEPKVIDELLVQSADRFKQLRCNLIVTPPISLVLRAESDSLQTVFRCETMPTVKLRPKSDDYWTLGGAGPERMLEVLKRRIDMDALMPDVAARNRLVAASGGAVRELLELAQDATLEASGKIITLADVEAALSRRRNQMRNRIDVNGWWDALIEIGKTKELSDGDKCLAVLFHRMAFQYNGDVWHDVHPLVSEMPKFREAMKPSGPKKKASRG